MTEPSIFIKLYFDEDVSVILAEILRPHGFDVLTTRDAENLGNSATFKKQVHHGILSQQEVVYDQRLPAF